MNRTMQVMVMVIALAVIVTLLPEIGKTGENNLYALQAEAFLHGRLDLPLSHHDVVVVDGRYYVPFPPFPALVLLPFVALLGVNHTYTVVISLALTALNIYLFRRILQKLELSADAIFWLIIAFFFGTGYWYVTLNTAGVWFFAHIVAISCMLLGIRGALDGRSWLVGLMVGFAFLSRQFNLFNALFLWVLLLESHPQSNRREKAGLTLNFGLSLGLCVIIYMLFNAARFGSPMDTGYAYLPQVFFLKDRLEQYGLFSLAYVPFNFFQMFVNGFWVKFTDPTQTRAPEMELLGTSIIVASPFLLAAFWARWRPALLAAAWATIGIITIGLLLYFVNGWTQVNTQRYTLDFMPVLMLLVALGTKRIAGNWWKWAVVYAVSLNILALIIMPFLNWLLA